MNPFLSIVVLVMLSSVGFAQTPPKVEEAPIKFGEVKLETASLPGSSLKWTKVVASFTTKEQWMDGVVFSALAVLGDKGSHRLVTGNVRYANIPAGTHNAVFYISPWATARFGTPEVIEITALYREVEADSVKWKSETASNLPSDWKSLNTYQGVLVNIMSTPWIMIDYEKSPDVLGIH